MDSILRVYLGINTCSIARVRYKVVVVFAGVVYTRLRIALAAVFRDRRMRKRRRRHKVCLLRSCFVDLCSALLSRLVHITRVKRRELGQVSLQQLRVGSSFTTLGWVFLCFLARSCIVDVDISEDQSILMFGAETRAESHSPE